MDSRLCSLATLLGWCVAGLLLAGMLGEIHADDTSTTLPYTSAWFDVDWDELLESKRLIQHYFDCLMGTGKCQRHMKNFKNILPEALATGCARCTEEQIRITSNIFRCLRESDPEKFNMLAKKYDPEGIYTEKYLNSPRSLRQNALK